MSGLNYVTTYATVEALKGSQGLVDFMSFFDIINEGPVLLKLASILNTDPCYVTSLHTKLKFHNQRAIIVY